MKILIATHKESILPTNDIFLPIQVGRKIAEIKLDMQGDDEGENISEKNPNYCELTAHYWAWKNLKNIDYIGLCHYRRYFDFNKSSFISKVEKKISQSDLLNIDFNKDHILKNFKNYDIILSKGITYPYNLKTNYCYEHIIDDFKIMENVIKTKFPDYYKSFKIVFNGNKLSHYNMFITNSYIFNDYSKWIFNVLFEIEKSVKISEYPFQRRVFGYMSERLLMVFCYHHQLKIKYLPIIFVDEAHTKNVSLIYFLLRKFKYYIIYTISRIK